jgi:hypothetical protein
MTDTQTVSQTNGAGHTSTPKRKIASASYAGAVGTLTFQGSFSGTELSLDTGSVPPAQRDALAAYGAITAMQAAYGASPDDPIGAAKACMAKILNGTWSPGPPRREAEVDPLVEALRAHLHSGKPDGSITHAYVEHHYIPAYQAKHGFASVGAARRKLREHPDIAAGIAKINADRAAKLAASLKKAPKESLDL